MSLRAPDMVTTGARWKRPLSVLAVGQAITSAGDGAWLTVWTIYLTRFGGLSASEFALGATLGGVLALLVGVPLGRLADRVGPKRVLISLTALGGMALGAFLGVTGFWTFLPVALTAVACDKARVGVFQAYVTGLADTSKRVAELGRQQAARSIGFTLGGAAGGVALAFGSLRAFVILILVNFASNIVYALVLLRLPAAEAPRCEKRTDGMRVLKDLPYVSVAAVGGVLALGWSLLSNGVPLWMTHHTDVPPQMVGVLIVLNGLLVALFQVRAARADNSRHTAARKVLWAALILAGACALFALTGLVGRNVGVALALAAGCVHALAEVLFVAAYWGLSLALMPDDAAGEYQSMASAGTAVASVFAPLIIVPLVVNVGVAGWAILGTAFVLAGVVTMPLSQWADNRARRRRPVHDVSV
jgi:predicted MFS family arabinose efflux permease